MRPAHRENGLIMIAGPGVSGRGGVDGRKEVAAADSTGVPLAVPVVGAAAATLSQTESDRPPPQCAHVTQHNA